MTGGAGGIGQAVLARLGQDGFVPVSWDLSTDAKAASLALAVDVTDASALAAATDETIARAGPIPALVVNAGILGPVAPVWELAPEDIRRVIDTNLVSAFLTCRAVVPGMRERGAGRIVLMSSVQAKEGTALAGPYAAAKAGMIALAKTLAKEVADRGILVNAITPTVVRAAMERAITPERRADLLARIPLGRLPGAGGGAAEMVAFLCGPGSGFSTGAVFDLSGGRATW